VHERGGATTGNGLFRLELQSIGIRPLIGDVYPNFSTPFCIESTRDRQHERFHLGVHGSVIDQPSDRTNIAFLPFFLIHYKLFSIRFEFLGRTSVAITEKFLVGLNCKEYRTRDGGLVWRLQVLDVCRYAVELT
jgi:hypothetical protein